MKLETVTLCVLSIELITVVHARDILSLLLIPLNKNLNFFCFAHSLDQQIYLFFRCYSTMINNR